MVRTFVLGLATLILVTTAPVRGQFTAEAILEKKPLNFFFSSDVTLSRDRNNRNNNVAGSAKLVAELRHASDVLAAMMPELNRRIAKAVGSPDKFVVTEIRPQFDFASPDNRLKLEAVLQVHDDGAAGDATFVVPIEISVKNQQIVLENKGATLQSHNLYWRVGFRVPDRLVRDRSEREVTTKVGSVIGIANSWIKSKLIDPMRRQIDAWRLQQVALKSPKITWSGDALRIEVELSGQAAVTEVDNWIRD
ncbi:MAG TPA: hypothetical protein VFB45_05200 [Pseudolabrys sp.]|nr:hypothetical protein [Pseudolabrys sp.]